MAAAQLLILFTRYPKPGSTKTRLIPLLGADGAARLQKSMTETIAASVRRLALDGTIETVVCHHGGSTEEMQSWLGHDFIYQQQGPGDIGQRMLHALRNALDAGAKHVVLVGSDIPGLSTTIMAEAFDRLHHSPVVLGPALDGGYYLIGVRDDIPSTELVSLFSDIPWSTAEVFLRTVHRLEAAGLTFAPLPLLRDVDEPTDLSGSVLPRIDTQHFS
ncbi:TIGR04282 family arsenosugar biosynthesis glycosyltransferase [Desulfobulbus alkaliphilus]|uniref:TIGR04282 family arsenosugar biosynthesis glycosyltransferase n=1 Tax=Desulfobulbus alkaliphilus TaxID=869814 RepID=UPI0019649C5A|nr:TIGR04282 family arsenosugar biosynthesis glycosyltransferase [Desulfobulbus alkaliphilus]MBM9537299.1 TIGR04282 family arsenosugar biosynthesis glycosyltransferase [Desulfobulbus alkaliphilus]